MLRTAYMLPMIVTGVVAAELWQPLFNSDGLANSARGSIGLGRPDWFGDPQLAWRS